MGISAPSLPRETPPTGLPSKPWMTASDPMPLPPPSKKRSSKKKLTNTENTTKNTEIQNNALRKHRIAFQFFHKSEIMQFSILFCQIVSIIYLNPPKKKKKKKKVPALIPLL